MASWQPAAGSKKMKLSDLHETDLKLKGALKRIYDRKYFGRATVQQPKDNAGIDPGASTLDKGQGGFATDQGIPTNPRHRQFFGIREG